MRRVDFLSSHRKPARFRADASFVYRCENLALALRAAGAQAGLAHIAGYRVKAGVSAVVLHRPQYSLRLRWLIHLLKQAGVQVFIDIDDLIFDPEFAAFSPAVVNGILPLSKLQRRFAAHARALGLADEIIVSTAPLAEHVRRVIPGVPVTVIGNSVHMTWRSLEPAGQPEPGAARIITYTPGTRSHDQDFRQIAGALERFLDAHPDIELHITGHLNHDLRSRSGQVVHRPKVAFDRYAERLWPGWVNLSPLEPTPFNECKSALKVIEAGYWNVPTICSPNPDAGRFVGAGAIIAETEQDWLDALERLLDAEEYARASDGLRQRVLTLADPSEQCELLLERCERGSRRGPRTMSSMATQALARLALFQRDVAPARIGAGWMPAWVSAGLAQRRRRLGLYDAATSALLEQAWKRRPTPSRGLAYARFRRDLGRLPTREEALRLLGAIAELSAAEARLTVNLVLESGLGPEVVAAVPRAQLLGWAPTSPPIASAVFAADDQRAGLEQGLARLHRSQDDLRDELARYLRGHAGSICIVGNAGALVGSAMGSRIDAHQVVVRFNHYRSATTRDEDIGSRIDVWVRAPDLRGFEPANPDPWILLSGPDVRYHLRDWGAVRPHLEARARVLSMPLEVWAALVGELEAPPSAGVLFIAWAIALVGAAAKLTVVGFQSDGPAASQYHQALPQHVPSTRHNWAGERALLRRWRDEGLVFLG